MLEVLEGHILEFFVTTPGFGIFVQVPKKSSFHGSYLCPFSFLQVSDSYNIHELRSNTITK